MFYTANNETYITYVTVEADNALWPVFERYLDGQTHATFFGERPKDTHENTSVRRLCSLGIMSEDRTADYRTEVTSCIGSCTQARTRRVMLERRYIVIEPNEGFINLKMLVPDVTGGVDVRECPT